jgi:hypothetical protein
MAGEKTDKSKREALVLQRAFEGFAGRDGADIGAKNPLVVGRA